MKKGIIKIIYVFSCIIIIFTKECYAYLDPSAMTYVIQIVSGIAIALATSIGIFFYKLKRFFKDKKENKSSHTNSKQIVDKSKKEI